MIQNRKRLEIEITDDDCTQDIVLPRAHRITEWNEVVDEYILDVKTRLAPKTAVFYRERMNVFLPWVIQNDIGLADFNGRTLRRYIHYRQNVVSQMGKPLTEATIRHDVIALKALFKFAYMENLTEKNVLKDYVTPSAEAPSVAYPNSDEVKAILKACQDRWKPALNPPARFYHAPGRAFQSRRSYALLTGLLTSCCRISEMLDLRIQDYRPDERLITIVKSKSNRPRTLPVEPAWIDIMDNYLKVRPKKSECDYLFVNEWGTQLTIKAARDSFSKDIAFAGVRHFTLHSLRHVALSSMSRYDIIAAMEFAGHSSVKTTQRYTHREFDAMKDASDNVGMLSKLLINTNTRRNKPRKLI